MSRRFRAGGEAIEAGGPYAPAPSRARDAPVDDEVAVR